MAILAGATPQLPSASELAQLRVKLAGIIGEPNLQILEPAWVNLMREGVIVTLHAGRWRAEREFNLEELGVAARDNADGERLRKWFRLGSKRLLPARYLSRLDSLDTNARKWLTTCGMKTYWGVFVSADAYPRWKEAHKVRYEDPYFALRDEIYRNYKTIINEVLDEYRQIARENYRRLVRQEPGFADRHPDLDLYTAAVVLAVQQVIPTAEDVRDSFYFTSELTYIPLPSLLAEDLATAQRLEADSQAATELRREVYAMTLRQKEALVTTFMRDAISKINGMLYEVSTDVLASIRNNGKLVGKSAEQLRAFTGQMEQYLQFAPNDDVEQMLAQVRQVLDIPPGEARQQIIPRLEAQLGAVATLTRDVLVRLGDTPRSTRTLGIPDTPTPDLVRAARQTLELEPPPAIAANLGQRGIRPAAAPIAPSLPPRVRMAAPASLPVA